MPVLNAARFLPTTVPAIGAAVEAHGSAELIIVDNGSTDGSWAWLVANAPRGTSLVQEHGVRVGAVRNAGVRHARGGVLSFLDADCLVGPDYLRRAEAALARSGCAVTGSRYALPDRPHWIERSWDALHAGRGDGAVPYINAGNLVVRREAFEAVGGFDPALESGEDAELCARLRRAGYCLSQAGDVRAVHLGNARTLGAFYRKQLWHGMGALGTARLERLDRPLLMTLVHVAVVAAAAVAAFLAPWSTAARAGLLGAALLAVPLATVAYRVAATRGLAGAPGGAVLYLVYFTARTVALIRLALRRARS
jgi:glycosyltransferase involved in cell wall biosynthesis